MDILLYHTIETDEIHRLPYIYDHRKLSGALKRLVMSSNKHGG